MGFFKSLDRQLVYASLVYDELVHASLEYDENILQMRRFIKSADRELVYAS